MTELDLTVIGDRINPGFKSTRAMIEANDLGALQALAVRQRDAGATYLDLTLGPRAREDTPFLIEVIKAVQDAVATPLCFDDPSLAVQTVCLQTYDQDRAGGERAMVNSIAETRWELAGLMDIGPVKFIMMSSERVEDGARKQNKTADEQVMTAKRMADKLLAMDRGLTLDDLIVDVAVNAISSDTEGLTRASLETIRRIGADPDLEGIHMSCGLSNLAAQLPNPEIDGIGLKLGLECAFLTQAVAYGFDMVLATPWRDFRILEDDHPIMTAFREIIALEGLDALRRLRRLYRPA